MYDTNLDLCGDKYSWSSALYDDSGASITVIIDKNHGVTKVGQIFVLGGLNLIRMCEYIHKHKLQNIPNVWMVMVQNKLNSMVEQLWPMVEG